MKTEALKIHIEQLAVEVERSLATGHDLDGRDTDAVCALIDCKEYLRRAWHTLDQSPFEANDTQAETLKQMEAKLDAKGNELDEN